MARSLDSIARFIADRAVSEAEAAGYQFNPGRAMFYRSDLMSLENGITIWLQDHMVERATPDQN